MSFDHASHLFLDLCGTIATIMVLVALVRQRRTGRLGMDAWQASAGYGLILFIAVTQVLRPENTAVTRAIFMLTSIAAMYGLVTVLRYRRR